MYLAVNWIKQNIQVSNLYLLIRKTSQHCNIVNLLMSRLVFDKFTNNE